MKVGEERSMPAQKWESMVGDNEGMGRGEAVEGRKGTGEFKKGEGESRQESGVEGWILCDFL